MSPEKKPPVSDLVKGIAFASVTTCLWGTLPIIMKIALHEFSSGTIVWFRFLFAFVVLYFVLSLKKQEPFSILKRPPMLGFLAGLCLAANYYFFLQGIFYSSPSHAAVLIQTAPVLLVLAGVWIFRERFISGQWAGLALAIFGFLVFHFNQGNSPERPEFFALANGMVLFSGLAWAAFMVLQKQLQKNHPAQNLNLLVYITACLVLIPMADFGEFAGSGGIGWGLLVFLGLNTLLAYGCLSEAIRYIPLSLISVIVTLNPFITMTLMRWLPDFLPGWLDRENIVPWGYVGACIAISGVVIVLSQHKETEKA